MSELGLVVLVALLVCLLLACADRGRRATELIANARATDGAGGLRAYVASRYENLVFGAGGTMGAAHCGFMLFMQTHGLLRCFKRFAGSSVGSLAAAACAMGMDAAAIGREFADVDVASLASRGAALSNFVRSFVARGASDADVSFGTLHARTGKTLVITGTCASLRRCVYFTHTDPAYADMPVALALTISCSVPFLMAPVSYKGMLFADGAITDALPLTVFDSPAGVGRRATMDEKRASRTLGVRLLCAGAREHGNGYQDVHRVARDADELAVLLLESAMRQIHLIEASDPYYRERVVHIHTHMLGGMTDMHQPDTAMLVEAGYADTHSFFAAAFGGRGASL
jgi:predicted acylesterase/phospholipase RssA